MIRHDTIFGFLNENKKLSRITPRYGRGGFSPSRTVSYLLFSIEGYDDTIRCDNLPNRRPVDLPTLHATRRRTRVLSRRRLPHTPILRRLVMAVSRDQSLQPRRDGLRDRRIATSPPRRQIRVAPQQGNQVTVRPTEHGEARDKPLSRHAAFRSARMTAAME